MTYNKRIFTHKNNKCEYFKNNDINNFNSKIIILEVNKSIKYYFYASYNRKHNNLYQKGFKIPSKIYYKDYKKGLISYKELYYICAFFNITIQDLKDCDKHFISYLTINKNCHFRSVAIYKLYNEKWLGQEPDHSKSHKYTNKDIWRPLRFSEVKPYNKDISYLDIIS